MIPLSEELDVESVGSRRRPLRTAIGKMRRLGVRGTLRSLARRVVPQHVEFRIYALPTIAADAAAGEPAGLRMRQNEWADLRKFRPIESWHDKSRFLAEARQRIERGEQVFTCADDELLLHYGWFAPLQRESLFSEVGKRYTYAPGSAVLYDFYTDPSARGRGMYRSNLRQMLRLAAHDPGIKQVCISVRSDNAASRHVIESVGFQYQTSLLRD